MRSGLRRGRLPVAAVTAALVVVSCTSAGSGPAATTAPSSPPVVVATSAVPPTPSTTPPPNSSEPQAAAVRVRLDAAEADAVAIGGWVELVGPGGLRARLDPEQPETTLTMRLPATIVATHHTAAGLPTAVTWEQPVTDTQVAVRQPWRKTMEDRAARPSVSLVWQANGDRDTYLAQLDRAAPHVTHVSPISWFVTAEGEIAGGVDAVYVAAVHERGLRIWPTLAGLDADANHRLLHDPAHRSKLARRISDEARDAGADGVNLDIEGFRVEDAAAFTAFVAEVAEAVHGWGGEVSYDLIPRTDTWEVSPPELAYWSTAPQRRELAALVDFTVVMAYDQYNRLRPAGPVAGPRWVDDVVRYALRDADASTLVLGVPFYGRIWDPDEPDRPRTVGVHRIAALAASGEVEPDPHGVDRVTLEDGRFLWAETPEVIAARLSLVERYRLAGWAAWRLGFDSPQLWEAIAAR